MIVTKFHRVWRNQATGLIAVHSTTMVFPDASLVSRMRESLKRGPYAVLNRPRLPDKAISDQLPCRFYSKKVSDPFGSLASVAARLSSAVARALVAARSNLASSLSASLLSALRSRIWRSRSLA
jgi:hypothetical protein